MSLNDNIRDYKKIRSRDLTYKFSYGDNRRIEYAYTEGDHKLPVTKYYDKRRRPGLKYAGKGPADVYAICLFNEIFNEKYHVNRIEDMKYQASKYIEWYENEFQKGVLAKDSDNMRFITAFSVSSFGGIQYAEGSQVAFDSMINTLESHNESKAKCRKGVWDIIRSRLSPHLRANPMITGRTIADAIVSAKQSSSSIPGAGKYRDWLFTTHGEEILNYINSDKIEYVYGIGVRNDRRSKYRMICSMSGHIRAIDFILTNGSYAICEGEGIGSKFTTEGMNNKQLYPEMKSMCSEGDYVSVCIDFKGYDSQIHKNDYIEFIKVLTEHHNNDKSYMFIRDFMIEGMEQPKPLAFRDHDSEVKFVIDNYRTLASGHHGTHSIENFMGIATYYYMTTNLGLRIKLYKTNGDDQNMLIHKNDVEEAMRGLNSEFKLSIPKSLIGHKLCIGSKYGFSKDYHPAPEIGTFRSIWERESSGINVVEPSKLASNYGKMIQVAIVLIRLGKSRGTIRNGLIELGTECSPPIDPDLIPKSLETLTYVKKSSHDDRPPAKGLEAQKHELAKRAFPYKMLNVVNFYEMLESLYRDQGYYDLHPTGIEYYPKETTLRIKRSHDYSVSVNENDSWLFRSLSRFVSNETNEDKLIRSILQNSNSNDGPCSMEYQFNDMVTLAISINDRNRRIGDSI